MRFSIRGLLAMTLLAALATTLFIQNQKNRRLIKQTTALTVEEAALKAKMRLQPANRRLVELCGPGIRKVEFPSPIYLQAHANFEKARAKYGRLEIKNPDLIAYRAIPSINPKGISRFACLIYVPEVGAELEIFATDGRERRKAISQYSFENEVRYSLPTGESRIEFEWNTNSSPATATLKVNNDLVLEATHAGYGYHGAGWSSITNEQFELKRRDRQRLLGFHPNAEQEADSLNVVLWKNGGKNKSGADE